MEFRRFSLTRYRAFTRKVELELAPITIVIGSNHSGKTTLCRAPWFVSQPFARGASTPFGNGDPGGAPPITLLRVAQGLSGFEAELEFVDDDGNPLMIELHATARTNRGNQAFFPRLAVWRAGALTYEGIDLEWDALRKHVREQGLEGLHESIDVLGGMRDEASLAYDMQDFIPTRVGFRGESAPEALRHVDDATTLDAWSKEHLGIVYRATEKSRALGGTFSIAVDDGHNEVPLPDGGTGIVQILPVAVALLLMPKLPGLYCIEHPELHLHPHAHRAVAELLLAGHQRHPKTRFLVETHSDTLILRLRRAVVEGRIAPDRIRIVHIDRGAGGSTARLISLNDRGVPDWWPAGVFAEAQAEYAAMRRELNARDRA
jgi:hypothetical protein